MWQPQGLYSQYVLRTPIVISGYEAIKELYNYPASRIAVIHGNSFFDKALFKEVFMRRNISFFRRSWKTEPTLDNIRDSLTEIERFRPDTIIAIGGGAVIDGAKLIRLLFEYPSYKFGETRLSGEQLRTKFIAVPTTVGSGAEVSSSALFFDCVKHKKEMVIMHELQPEVVIYDYRYAEGADIRLLVASILDAAAHILEGYVSVRKNELMDVLAEKGFSIMVCELHKIISGKYSEIDYQKLQYAGYFGGLVQNHCIVGAAHAFAHQLTDEGYSHSEGVALLLPHVIRMNSSDVETQNRYNSIMHSVGIENIDRGIDLLNTVVEKAGIYERMSDLKHLLETKMLDEQFCENVRQDKGGKGNPIAITDDYIREFVRSM